MTLPRPLLSKPIRTVPPPPLPSSFNKTAKLSPNLNRISGFSPHAFKFIVSMAASSRHGVSSDPQHSSSQLIPSNVDSDSSSFQNLPSKVEADEEYLDKVIYRFRFMAFLGVLGSLIGSFLCFIKGCTYVVQSFMEYSVNRSKVIWSLVEAIDVYLLGTVMLVFGMGLYELFISNLDIVKSSQENKPTDRSNLLGMFMLKIDGGDGISGEDQRLVTQEFLDEYVPHGAIVKHTMRELIGSVRIVPTTELQCNEENCNGEMLKFGSS